MIGFAHRGAPTAGQRENTLPAFAGALAAGATALESDVWLTADGVPVLVHDGHLRVGWRRRDIAATPRSALPAWLPSLADLYADAGTGFDLSLDVKDPAAGAPTIEVARAHGAAGRLWLCGSVADVRRWRAEPGGVHPVVSTTLRVGGAPRRMDDGRIDEAAAAGADALNLRAPEWTAERVARCHDRGLLAFAWGVQQAATLARVREFGCDAIYSDFLTLLIGA